MQNLQVVVGLGHNTGCGMQRGYFRGRAGMTHPSAAAAGLLHLHGQCQPPAHTKPQLIHGCCPLTTAAHTQLLLKQPLPITAAAASSTGTGSQAAMCVASARARSLCVPEAYVSQAFGLSSLQHLTAVGGKGGQKRV